MACVDGFLYGHGVFLFTIAFRSISAYVEIGGLRYEDREQRDKQ